MARRNDIMELFTEVMIQEGKQLSVEQILKIHPDYVKDIARYYHGNIEKAIQMLDVRLGNPRRNELRRFSKIPGYTPARSRGYNIPREVPREVPTEVPTGEDLENLTPLERLRREMNL